MIYLIWSSIIISLRLSSFDLNLWVVIVKGHNALVDVVGVVSCGINGWLFF